MDAAAPLPLVDWSVARCRRDAERQVPGRVSKRSHLPVPPTFLAFITRLPAPLFSSPLLSSHATPWCCLQVKLLTSALRAVKVGGTVVYATCSISPAENDAVVSPAFTHTKPETRNP